MIDRSLSELIEKYLHKNKILIIYGARQVGKTTLVKQVLKKNNSSTGYYNCELLSVKRQLESQNRSSTRSFLGDHSIIVLDEAQKVENIGHILKQLVDLYPRMRIIATGSSSFDLANKINEPLTGRALEFTLYPLSLMEIIHHESRSAIDEKLEKMLTYGLYPEVYLSGSSFAGKLIETIASQYLYRDVLELEELKKPRLLLSLLELLALQLGNEVSTYEIATQLQVGRKTIDRYIELLEKSFVIFRLRAFSRNIRKEITKKHKIYFYDLGIRNALLNRFNPLSLRDDIGALWENFLIVERMKYLSSKEQTRGCYFWRTHDQKEIDYLESYSGKIFAFELKWNRDAAKRPVEFLLKYPNSTFHLVNKTNYYTFVGL